VELTSPGVRYLSAIRSALDDIDDATRKLQASPNAGAVNICVAPAFLTHWLVPRVISFQQQYPDVELRLTASVNQIDLRYSDMDMAIFYGDGTWPGIQSHFLRAVRNTPLCSPKLLQESKPINSAEDLLQYPLIHISKRDQEWKSILTSNGVKRVDNPKGIMFSSTSLAMGAAMEGLGIALADPDLAQRELEYGQLVKPLDIYLDTKRSFYLAYQEGIPLTKSMEAFRDWILEEMQKENAKL